MASTYEPIATQTVAVATSSITFSSIPSTYTDLKLIFTCTGLAAGQDIALQYNGDTGTNYSYTRVSGSGVAATSGRNTSVANWRINALGVYTDTSIPITMQVDIFSYTGSTFKTGLSFASGDKNGSGYVSTNIGLWRNTAAITNMTISSATNFLIGTTATLYGIKNA
jgi:hypothetical protein